MEAARSAAGLACVLVHKLVDLPATTDTIIGLGCKHILYELFSIKAWWLVVLLLFLTILIRLADFSLEVFQFVCSLGLNLHGLLSPCMRCVNELRTLFHEAHTVALLPRCEHFVNEKSQ